MTTTTSPGRTRMTMARLGRALAALALVAAGAARAEPPALHQTGPVPAWVEAIEPREIPPPADQVSNGVQYLLIDTQTRVDEAERVTFRRLATKALNERGLESAANIELRFDPSYQKLTLHAINLRRGGQVIAKLPGAKVKILQREAALESLIYDGTRTAHVFLEDVRIGDVVEYSYSLRGHNPVFRGRHFGGFDLQYGVPVARLHARLLWPTGRPLHWQHLAQPAKPRVTMLGGHGAYTWDLQDVAGRTVESDAPAWFAPHPSVQWSEFADWQAVSDWALPLYAQAGAPGPRLRAVIDQLGRQHAEPAARLEAALQYVQGEVRYLGIEVGPGSHAPNPPERVLERRYGDCKDKTLLLVSLLRGLGIEAAPALVHTTLRHSIETHQPSPAAFNHVVVRARSGGQELWLDPTRTTQKAQLPQIVQADFGRALVVAPDTRALSRMAGEQALRHHREVKATLDARGGVDKPVGYEIKTTARGAAAESLRAALAAQSRETVQQQYINFYTAYFGEMEVAAPFAVVDDPARNALEVTERYVLKAFWQRPEGKRRVQGQIEVPDLSDYLRAPRQAVRQSPLALAHPAELLHTTQLLLPEDWTINDDDLRVEDKAFSLTRQQRWDARSHTLTLTDHYRSLVDHVPVADMATYTASLAKARHESSLYIYKQDDAEAGGGNGGMHWIPALTALLALAGWLALAVWLYRWNPARGAGLAAEPAPPAQPLGGWLWLPAIGLPLTLARLVHGSGDLWPALSTNGWHHLTDPQGPAYQPFLGPLMLAELVGNLGLLVIGAVTTVLFFQRRCGVPRLYIGFLVAGVALQWADLVTLDRLGIAGSVPTARDWGEVIRGTVIGLVWVLYFVRSQRVKATFVRRFEPRRAAPAAAAEPAATA